MSKIESEVLPWETIRERIYGSLTNPVGYRLLGDLYANLPKYFDEKKLQEMLDNMPWKPHNELLAGKLTDRLLDLLGAAKEYTVRDPWYSVLSVKLVLPSKCQANCAFCYNKHGGYGRQVASTVDYTAMVNALLAVMRIALGRPISVEITGGEPTSDPYALDKLLDTMAMGGINRNDQVKRITMTSNGYHLYECMSGLVGKVKYVNLSLHSTDFEERTKIFGTRNIPNNEEIVILTEEAAREGIDMSGVFVVDDFSMDMEKFDSTNAWCEKHGLVATRWRSNVFEKNKVGVKEFAEKLTDNPLYKLVVYEEAADSCYAILTRNGSHLVYLLDGVEDSTQTSLGVSVVIRGDGKMFHDASCRMPVLNWGQTGFLPLKYVYDKKERIHQ